jgi:hypothetical protein
MIAPMIVVIDEPADAGQYLHIGLALAHADASLSIRSRQSSRLLDVNPISLEANHPVIDALLQKLDTILGFCADQELGPIPGNID